MNAAEFRQLFVLAEDLFDHGVERPWMLALRLADQPAQALKILRGIAQAVDVVEPQALQLALRDQLFDQGMDGVERAGILDAQPRQRVDVEEAAVVDVAGSEPPVAEPVVLAFEQMMQRQRWRGAFRPGAVGGQSAFDDIGAAVDRFQLGLEGGRFAAVGMTQAACSATRARAGACRPRCLRPRPP